MELGLQLNTTAPAGTDMRTYLSEMLDRVRLAQDAGFDVVSVGQHYLFGNPKFQPIPLLGRLAAESGKMTLATGILILPLHHPIEIAEQVATLDAIAGDVIVGVGAGYRDSEFENFGVDKTERGSRLEEGIELLRRFWTEDEVTFDGRHYSVSDVTINPKPVSEPPVWVAATDVPAIERAAKLGDRWFIGAQSTIPEIAEQKEAYDAIRENRGQDTEVAIFRETYVAPTTERALEVAREPLQAKYQRYLRRGFLERRNEQSDIETAVDTTFGRFAENRFLIGTPAEVCEEIERYERQLDVSHLLFHVHVPGASSEAARTSIELLGDEVIANL